MSQSSDTWQCSLCSYINLSSVKSCEMCDSAPPTDESPNDCHQTLHKRNNNKNTEVIKPIYMQYNNDNSNNISNNDDSKTSHQSVNQHQWQCKKCTCFNHTDLNYCEVCLSERANNTHTNYSTNKQITVNQNNDNHSGQYKPEYKQEYTKSVQQENNYQNTSHTNALDDISIAETLQKQEAERMKQYYADLETAKQLAKQMDFEQNMSLAQQMQVEEQQRMKEFHKGIEAAKHLEQKYQSDEIQFQNDRQIALKMQKEFAEGLAWFCASCFTMNLNVQSFECDACGTKRPKPKIPDVLTVRDQVAMKMIEMLRNCAKTSNLNCIVNLAFAQNFVTKYLQMCKKRGLQIAKPRICYHWTRQQFFEPIKKTGLKVPDGQKVKHMTDTGYYGKGIYMSPDPKYAKGYGYGAKLFFAALSLTGKQYSAKYPRDLGCSLKDGYDSHFSSDRVNKQTNIPNEWIFFKPEQLLLCFHMSLDQVQYVVPVLNQVINYLVSKYDKLNKSGGIRGL